MKRTTAIGILVSLVLGGLSTPTSAASLNETYCEKRSYMCVNETVGQYPIVTGYKGSDVAYSYDVAPDGSFIPHNCTSYVAYRFYKVMGYRDANYNRLGNAGSWATSATKYIPGALVSGSPSEGDVAQWNWGHVAWVDYVEYDTSGRLSFIVISEDTYNLKVTRRRKLSPLVTDEWPHNFISLPIFGGGGGGGGGHMIATSSPYSP